MEMTLNYSSAFCELGCDELEGVNGGINWSGVMNGVAIVGGGLLGIAGVFTAPIWVPALGAFCVATAGGYYIVKNL